MDNALIVSYCPSQLVHNQVQADVLKKIGGNFTILFFQGRRLCHLDFIALKQMTVITEDTVLRKGVKLSPQQPCGVRTTLVKQSFSRK